MGVRAVRPPLGSIAKCCAGAENDDDSSLWSTGRRADRTVPTAGARRGHMTQAVTRAVARAKADRLAPRKRRRVHAVRGDPRAADAPRAGARPTPCPDWRHSLRHRIAAPVAVRAAGRGDPPRSDDPRFRYAAATIASNAAP